MVAIGAKADMPVCIANVCFGPIADMLSFKIIP
jgi:hypothetical protein